MQTRLNVMDMNVNNTSIKEVMIDTNMFSTQHDGGSNNIEGENRNENDRYSIICINGSLPKSKTIISTTRTMMFPTSQGRSDIIGNVGDPKSSSQLLAAGKASPVTNVDPQHKKKDDTACEQPLVRRDDAARRKNKMHQGSYAQQDAEIAPGATYSKEGGVLICSSSCPADVIRNKGVEEINTVRATTHAARPASNSSSTSPGLNAGICDNKKNKEGYYDNRSSRSDGSARSDCSNEHDKRNGKTTKDVDEVLINTNVAKKVASSETPGATVIENKKDPYQEQSDRKRSRERKRRQDISAAIDKLITILVEIDPENLLKQDKQIYFTEDSIIANINKRRCNGGSFLSNQQNQPLNRTEIINYTAHIIEKLAWEREQISLQIKQYDNIIAARSRNQEVQEAPAAQGNFVITRMPVSTNNEATSTLQQIQQSFATGFQQQQQQPSYHQIFLSPSGTTIVPPAPPISGGHNLVAHPMTTPVTSIPTNHHPIQFNHTIYTQQWQQPQMQQHQNFHQQSSANLAPTIGAATMPYGAHYPITVANGAPAVTTTNIMTTTNYKQSDNATACCENEKID